MARFGDKGPYTIINVKCELHEINSVEGLVGKIRSKIIGERISKALTGKKLSSATKAKLSQIRKGRPWSAARRAAHEALYGK